MPRLKLIEMDSFNKMIYFRKDDKLIAFDADVAIELISDSLDGKIEPVRQGYWIRKDYDIECSECHARIDERDLRWAIDTEAKYCLNCGCKMDEVIDE